MRTPISCAVLYLSMRIATGQHTIVVGPRSVTFTASIDGPISLVQTVDIGVGSTVSSSGGGGVSFKYDHVATQNNNIPNFVVLPQSSGIAPTNVPIGLNENVIRRMAPGSYTLDLVFSTTNQSPPSMAGVDVILNLNFGTPLTIQSVVNTSSYQPLVSPGCAVSIFGTKLGLINPNSSYNELGLYPTDFGSSSVTFNGIPAPLLYVAPGQINAIVPYGVTGKTADVVVTRFGRVSSAPFSVPLSDTSPGIFTSTPNGVGQGVILNYPQYNYNSAGNPAPKGSVIVMFATGIGVWDPPVDDGRITGVFNLPVDDGRITLFANRFTAKPVSLTIGGQPATIYYAGTSPYQLWGLLQVTAYVPTNIGSGEQPVVLKIGDNDNARQKVTMVVQ